MSEVSRQVGTTSTPGPGGEEGSMGRGLLVAAASALLIAALAGCSSAKAMTCSEYGSKDSSGRTAAVMSLIRAHDLEPTSSAYGTAMVAVDVDGFCGITLVDGQATQNQDSAIDEGVNWSEYGD